MAIDVRTQKGLGVTLRQDNWWGEPLAIAAGLITFIVYMTWAALTPTGPHGEIWYKWGSYISPAFSPYFSPSWFRWSPAILILWAPAGFRATCYYFRKAYYRAFFQDPPGCAVGEESREYKGESSFPFILQNLHRYFLYLAILLVINHWIDLAWAFTKEGPKDYYVGVGTLVLLVDTILLTFYVGSCHAWRHLVGGKLDCFSTCPINDMRYKIWCRVTKINEHHGFWAWASLFT
ncbi:MAG TPA: succinate dehydrogenase, partial [bacterium]|nr:succinate dehydrogenase [bacterium]